MSSTSHENVCALYIYAKTRFEGLINSGDVNFSYSWDGNVKSYFYKSDAINQVKDELLLLKSALEDQNYE